MADGRTWFWLPQVEAATGQAGKGSALPWEAACRAVDLVRDREIHVPWAQAGFAADAPPNGDKQHYSSPCLDKEFLDRLTGNLDKVPLYVFGTCSFDEAVRLSWEAYGLNVFDLPWGLETPEPNTKAIRYVPILKLPDLLRAAGRHARASGTALGLDPAQQQLRWAYCHDFNCRVRRSVGHGETDRLQVMCATEISSQLCSGCRPPEADMLPCGSACRFRREIERLLQNGVAPRDQLAASVAELGCGLYKIAPLLYEAPQPVRRSPPFDRVIVLEDCQAVREDIARRLVDLRCVPSAGVAFADVAKSQDRGRLVGPGGEPLLTSDDGPQTLACFDLELSAEREKPGIPKGLRLLYRESCEHRQVRMMIVTGYRRQQLRGLGLRAGSFLLKPFTNEMLSSAVELAEVAQEPRVIWVYLDEGAAADREFIGTNLGLQPRIAGFHDLLGREPTISATTVSELRAGLERPSRLPKPDLYVLDLAALSFGGKALQQAAEALIGLVSALRAVDSDTPAVIVWPTGGWRTLDTVLFGPLRLVYHCGRDRVLYKPFWIQNPVEPDVSLIPTVRSAMATQPSYSVKFTIPLPVAPLLGRFDWQYVAGIAGAKPRGRRDWSPFLTPLVKAFGFSASVAELQEMSRTLLGERLASSVCDEIIQNKGRWGALGEALEQAAKAGTLERRRKRLVKFLLGTTRSGKRAGVEGLPGGEALRYAVWRFVDWLQGNAAARQLRGYLTLESWTRAKCSPELHRVCDGVFRLFGGDTRFELYARGRWRDESRAEVVEVEDLLVVVEFLANMAVVSREFVREEIVLPVLRELGEDAVLVQETPASGILEFR